MAQANPAVSLSEALAAAVAAGEKSLLRVEARRRGPASGIAWTGEHVLTASHVVEWEDDIEVGLPDGSTAGATLVGRDPSTDLAVLKVAGSGLTPPLWRDTSGLAAGHVVLALSRPGRAARASLGIVSALVENWRSPAGGRLDVYLQCDVPLQPGLSGGLLMDVQGNAIGLDTAGLLRGVALAVPHATLARVAEAILAHGQVRRGFLGIGTTPVRLPKPIASVLGRATGLLIVSVEDDSPAAQAGLVLGDTLVALDATPLAHPADLLSLLEEDRIGRPATLRVLRVGELREVVLTVGQRPGRRP